jgi:RimJ/RimL family protein N-acetyltransferase
VSNQLCVPSVQNDEVIIRPWQHEDDIIQQAWHAYADPFSSLWNLPRSTPGGNVFSFFCKVASQRRLWAVDTMSGELIGRISLRDIDQWKQQARLGISLKQSYVGRGLGTQVLTMFLDYFFGPLNFATMVLDVGMFNRRAVRCYERLNFRCVGYEWRYAGYEPCVKLIEDPAYRDLRPCFRRAKDGIWAKFLEMELHKTQWHSRPLRPAQPDEACSRYLP